MDMELLRYFPTSKMQQAILLGLWMTLAADLMRTKTCTKKVNETSDFATILIHCMSSVIKPLKKIKRILYLTVTKWVSFSMLNILSSSWENVALVIHVNDVIPIRYRYCAPK